MAKKAYCTIRIDGEDYSSAVLPRLISLSIKDKAGVSGDTASLTLDDTGGEIAMPRKKASIEIELGREGEGGGIAFKGVVNDVKSAGSRSGLTLSIEATGFDSSGKAKENKRRHWDNATVSDVLNDAAKDAGLESVAVDDDLAGIKRSYWAQNGESFLAFGQRIAKEVGGTFKIADKKAILAKRGGGKSPSGKPLATVPAVWGDNLISWDITPSIGRNSYAGARRRWYDPKEAKWKEAEAKGAQSDDDDGPILDARFSSPDEAEAGSRSATDDNESRRQSGGGSIQIDGDYRAQPEGLVSLSGARAGIDGEYRIDGVDHNYSRSGWTTTLELKEPQGEAGKDNRPSKSGKKGKSKSKKDAGPKVDLGSY